MPQHRRIGDVEVAQDIVYQRKAWVFQRVGWALMGVLLVAALVGLFGHGPLSRATAGDEGDPIQVEYERFWRLQSPMTLRLLVAPAAIRGGEARIWVGRKYLERFSIPHVLPEPASVEAAADRYHYVFAAREATRPVAVTFEIEPTKPGRLKGEAGLEEGPGVTFAQWIHP